MYIKESRRPLLIRDQISSSGYWDHMNDKIEESKIQLLPTKINCKNKKIKTRNWNIKLLDLNKLMFVPYDAIQI